MKHLLIIIFTFSFLIINAQSTLDNWVTNQNDARIYASANDDNILMVFAGSDWCRPCIQFKKDILDSEDFKTYASDNLVILYLDFPSKKKNRLTKEDTAHNEALAEKYNKSGAFPKIVLFDKSMNKVKNIAYDGQSSANFINLLK